MLKLLESPPNKQVLQFAEAMEQIQTRLHKLGEHFLNVAQEQDMRLETREATANALTQMLTSVDNINKQLTSLNTSFVEEKEKREEHRELERQALTKLKSYLEAH